MRFGPVGNHESVVILGSTGSVGKSTVDVIKMFGRGRFLVRALVAHSDYRALAAQAIELDVESVAIYDIQYLAQLKNLLAGTNIKVGGGEAGIREICSTKVHIVVVAIAGFASILPTYDAIRSGSSKILIASKESMICAGRMLKEQASLLGNKIISVDSEHNGIFQVFDRLNVSAVESVAITGSGGPFRGYSKVQLESVSVADALKHPNWKMGKKITIDSATLFNKGLELIEAHYLFDLPLDKVRLVVNPQSIVHGLVQYKDGSLLAQMGHPDMRTPILHAMCWPTRYDGLDMLRPLNLIDLHQLTFESVDNDLFPSVELCRQAFAMGEQAVLLLVVADEVAVQYFLEGKIKFLDIFKIVSSMLTKQTFTAKIIPSIEDMLALERQFRLQVREFVDQGF